MITLPQQAVKDLLDFHKISMVKGFESLMDWCEKQDFIIRKIYDKKDDELYPNVIAFDINYKSLALTISIGAEYDPIISSVEYYEEG